MNFPNFNFSDYYVDYQTKVGSKDFSSIKTVNNAQKNYLAYLDKNFQDILVASLSDLKRHKEVLEKEYSFNLSVCLNKTKNKKCRKCSNCLVNNEIHEFGEQILKLLAYKNTDFANYFIGNNNRACYICNAQYTLIAAKTYKQRPKNWIINKKIQVKKYLKELNSYQPETKLVFQLDHFFPKSIYPGLSISLHNLIPICANCNLSKGNRELDYNSFLKLDDPDTIKFSIIEKSLEEFILGTGKLEIDVDDQSGIGIAEKFSFKGIYDNHVDYAEELIHRKIKYSNGYKQILVREFGGLNLDSDVIEDRLILGTYVDKDQIHKRPLSKFLQDINEQLEKMPK